MNDIFAAGGQSSTPYDDVFRTLLVDCSKLVIPVINELFGESYTGEEEIRFRQNEHFEGQQDGQSDKIITDSSFQIIGKTTKSYLFECQSTSDSSMLIRMFEYAAQIALESHTMLRNRMIVEIPHSAVLFLRSTENTPDVMTVEIRTSGGNVEFDVPVMKVRDYTIDDVFEKELFFLIPFYIFIYESKFKKMEEHGVGLEELKADYNMIFDRLDEAAEKGLISAFTRKTIMEMSGKVLEKIAVKYCKVMEGVRSVMGGKVLEYEAKTILNQGRAEGRVEGRVEGRAEGRVEGRAEGQLEKAEEMAKELYKNGVPETVIASAAKVSVDIIRKWLGIVTA